MCWPSLWNYFLFEIRSAQSLKAILYAPHFEMIYDFHFKMSKAFLFSFWNALWLSFWNEGAKIFVHKNILVNKNRINLLTKITDYLYFLYTDFYAVSMSLHLRWNTFYYEGWDLQCKILIHNLSSKLGCKNNLLSR